MIDTMVTLPPGLGDVVAESPSDATRKNMLVYGGAGAVFGAALTGILTGLALHTYEKSRSPARAGLVAGAVAAALGLGTVAAMANSLTRPVDSRYGFFTAGTLTR